MDGKQQLVGAAGMGLVLVEFWTSDKRVTVSSGLLGSGDTSAAHTALKEVGIEVLFVIGAALIAGIGDAWANAMIALVVVLGVLYAINHPHPFQAQANPAQPKGATP